MKDRVKRIMAIVIIVMLLAGTVASAIIPAFAKSNNISEQKEVNRIINEKNKQISVTETVSLGGDLTTKQEKEVLKLMGIDELNIQNRHISHTREVKELKKYLTMRYIGDIAISSTYIKKIGKGTKLRTININYVTNTMYKNIMDTLGMHNVSVTIAAPEPTFGSCAILGLIDGYERVTDESISSTRKTLALKEMKMTIDLNKKYGRKRGTKFWSKLKKRVIDSSITAYVECKAITKTMASLSDIELTTEEVRDVSKIMIQMAKYLVKEDFEEDFEEFSINNKAFGKEMKNMIQSFKKDTKERVLGQK